MQSVSSRIWTRVAVSISYDDNHYTPSASFCLLITLKEWYDIKHKQTYNNFIRTILDVWNVCTPVDRHCETLSWISVLFNIFYSLYIFSTIEMYCDSAFPFHTLSTQHFTNLETLSLFNLNFIIIIVKSC